MCKCLYVRRISVIFVLLLTGNIINMKNIGFIKAAQDVEQTEQMLNLMKEHGCVSVHVEEVRSSNRSRWQDFVD